MAQLETVRPSLVARVDELRDLRDGWDGDAAPAPGAGMLACASEFAAQVPTHLPEPSIGPAVDGGVVFEWDLPVGLALYCYARSDSVEVTLFDYDRDYVDISLPPRDAAWVVADLIGGLLRGVTS